MQKIQFYLVPNRITVTTDLVGNGFTTEYRKVYQRKLKLYKGIDNTIEIDVRDAGQRRENVVGRGVVLKFYDADHKNLFSAQGSAITSKPGLMSVTVSKTDLDRIDPQLLKMAAYLTGDSTGTILYADGQFDLFGQVEVLDGYNDKFEPGDIVDEITVFNYEYDTKEYISEIAKFGTKINDDISTVPTSTATFSYEGLYGGLIEVEATNDKSTAVGTRWTTIGVWDTTIDQTKTFTGNYRYVRFRVARDRTGGAGTGARFTVTKDDNVYTDVSAVVRGQNYLIGDQLTIKGGLLDGVDSINDLVITITGVTNGITTQGNVNTFTWTGIATSGSMIYESIGVGPVTRPPNPVDKIIIRN